MYERGLCRFMGIAIQFGKAEKQTLDANSMFIQIYGQDFYENLEKIKSLDNRQFIKEDKSWEVPFCYWEEVKQLFRGNEIKYVNEPPKAVEVSNDEILAGLDFNGFNLYDYQVAGVKYGLEHHNFLLLDEQRFRKVITSYYIG